MLKRSQRGDTIIEVLFAITIFSLVAVSGLSIMNQGVAAAQRSLEIGLVRQQIDTQADALRYLNQAYIADYGKNGQATTDWMNTVQSQNVGSAQPFDTIINAGACVLPTENAFALDVKKLSGNSSPLLVPTADTNTYAKVRYDGSTPVAEGIWVQAVPSPAIGNQPGFYDFHIRACWMTPGQETPVTLGTIVRLYEPRG